ncbi:MAG: ABC transporter ATP-binding protein [Chthonomonas sp.]|nr:ABC transporter ATP-binding protein [Chthonomonas sp.]
MCDYAIEVDQLGIQYSRKGKTPIQAVTDLSFQVKTGEIIGFLGPNGAGKSSTLKVLMGFVQPKSGSAKVFGLDAGTEQARKKIGYLPEVAVYYPYLTPLETLRLYGELQGLRGASLKRESQELLDLVGLDDAMNRLNRTMSKGMLQRVGIAQSLLGSPELLVLDEVTSGLDPVGRRELRNLLLDRQRQGATLLFSSHELAEVEMLCDRIILIDQGRLIEEREMTALKDSLRGFEVEFSGDIDLDVLPKTLESLGRHRWRATFSNKEDLLRAIDLIVRNRGVILNLIAADGSLEEYFVSTVGRAA